jgi:hypothetical protein
MFMEYGLDIASDSRPSARRQDEAHRYIETM